MALFLTHSAVPEQSAEPPAGNFEPELKEGGFAVVARERLKDARPFTRPPRKYVSQTKWSLLRRQMTSQSPR